MGSVFNQSWARDRHQRPQLKTCCMNQRKLIRVIDSETPNSPELGKPQKLEGSGWESGLTRSQTKPKMPGTVPTDRHKTIPNDSGPMSACFDDDLQLFNCGPTLSSPQFHALFLVGVVGRVTARETPWDVDMETCPTARGPQTYPYPFPRGSPGK